MGTLEQIKAHAEEIAAKAKAGQTLTKDEIAILKMATPPPGKAFNAGKRKIIKTGK